VVWVDDNPRPNGLMMDRGEAKGVTFVVLRSTTEAMEFFSKNRSILDRSTDRFRIVTDMARDEEKKLVTDAGLQLVEILGREYKYNKQIYVFTSDKYAKENEKKI